MFLQIYSRTNVCPISKDHVCYINSAKVFALKTTFRKSLRANFGNLIDIHFTTPLRVDAREMEDFDRIETSESAVGTFSDPRGARDVVWVRTRDCGKSVLSG